MNYWYGEYIDVNPVTVNTTVADSITESNATVRGTVAYSGKSQVKLGFILVLRKMVCQKSQMMLLIIIKIHLTCGMI